MGTWAGPWKLHLPIESVEEVDGRLAIALDLKPAKWADDPAVEWSAIYLQVTKKELRDLIAELQIVHDTNKDEPAWKESLG
jgi:hypothetical protein